MAVRIRLRRMGAKKRPFYRIVVADSRQARDGRFIDQIGYYDPLTNPPTVKLDEEKAKMWIGRGAQPSDVTRSLLQKLGVLAGKEAPAQPEPEPEPEAPKKRTRKKAGEEPTAEVAPEKKAKAEPKPKPEPEAAAEAAPELEPVAEAAPEVEAEATPEEPAAEESAPAEEQA